MKRVLLIALLLAATDAFAVQYVPLSLGLIYQPTAPSLTPGDCVSGTSPMVVAVDTGAHYACVNSGSSDYYAQISSVATTALALAANGANCSAGEAALGVNASGAAEGCWTPGGSGTVTSVSVVTANGVSGSVATATTTPAITLTLGAITPSSIAAGGTVTGSNLSGTNTGDQTCSTVSGCVVGAITAAGVPAAETDAAHDECSEISGCVPNSLTGTGTDGVLPVWDTGGLVDSHLAQTSDALHFQPSVTTAGHTADFDFSTLTNGRVYTFPDTDGTPILDTTIAPYIPFEAAVDTTNVDVIWFLSNDQSPGAYYTTYRYSGGWDYTAWFDVIVDKSITYVEFVAHQNTVGGGSNGARAFKFSRDPGYSGATLLTDQGGIASGGPVSTANGSTSSGSFKILEDSDNGTNWFKITAESITSDATCAIGTDGLIPLACQTLQTTVTGNAGTATALAADGSDCAAGSFPIGVSTTGAAQSCTTVASLVPAAETDAAHDTCAEISGCVVGALAAEVDGSTTNELQNIFQTVDAPTGTDPVADTTTDTLTLAASGSIAISGDSTTDTITFTVTETDAAHDTCAEISGCVPGAITTAVTSIATTAPITGGTITTTGTIACATCTTNAAALTANAIVIGGGSQATSALGSLGTTTTVLHGNAAGAPTFGAVVSGDITDGTVALADMANLAQDLFIGRVTASTGVPETATITAAARTVLDDTTVGAMVDTIGGATASGTGGLVRRDSPTFTTTATGVTEAFADADTSLATTGFVAAAGPTYARVSGSDSTVSGALAAVTGLTVALTTGRTYEFEAFLSATSSEATNGNIYAVQYSSTASLIEALATGTLAATSTQTVRVSALHTATAKFLTVNGSCGVFIKGIITTTGSGNLTIEHGHLTSGTTTTRIGSFLKVTRIA